MTAHDYRRFESRFKADPETGCWIWSGYFTPKGYGNFFLRRSGRWVRLFAHRASYEYHVGPIPTDLCVLHRCDNPPCVNPSHLFLGTRGDNNRDRASKGRTRPPDMSGEKNGRARLTEGDVVTICLAYRDGESPRSLSDRYGVHINHIRGIIKGKFWRHLALEPQAIRKRSS